MRTDAFSMVDTVKDSGNVKDSGTVMVKLSAIIMLKLSAITVTSFTSEGRLESVFYAHTCFKYSIFE